MKDHLPVLMAMGLKLIDGLEASDLDPGHLRSRTIRWGRVFMGIMMLLYRNRQSQQVDDYQELKG